MWFLSGASRRPPFPLSTFLAVNYCLVEIPQSLFCRPIDVCLSTVAALNHPPCEGDRVQTSQNPGRRTPSDQERSAVSGWASLLVAGYYRRSCVPPSPVRTIRKRTSDLADHPPAVTRCKSRSSCVRPPVFVFFHPAVPPKCLPFRPSLPGAPRHLLGPRWGVHLSTQPVSTKKLLLLSNEGGGRPLRGVAQRAGKFFSFFQRAAA